VNDDALRWFKVAELSEIEDGAVYPCVASGVGIALTRVGAVYGAVSTRCPHAGGPIDQGTLESGRIVCPWHGREYDRITGECEGHALSLLAFRVEARDDGIYVAVPGDGSEPRQ
jgi:nitrite reductase/ring-hydroxylating ferredoxin subunit